MLRQEDEVARLTFGGIAGRSASPEDRCGQWDVEGWGAVAGQRELEHGRVRADIVRCTGDRPGGVLDAQLTIDSEPDHVWAFQLLAWGDGATIADYESVLDDAIKTVELRHID